MVTFDDVLYKAKNLAEVAEKKAGDWIDVTKLKWAVNSLQKEQAATYEGMGRLWFEAHESGKDVTDMLEECCAHIKKLDTRIAGLQDRILQYKDAMRCPACTEANPMDSTYCRKCGAKMTE